MQRVLHLLFLVGSILVNCRESSLLFAADSTRPNVLFIAVDDLSPELPCY